MTKSNLNGNPGQNVVNISDSNVTRIGREAEVEGAERWDYRFLVFEFSLYEHLHLERHSSILNSELYTSCLSSSA